MIGRRRRTVVNPEVTERKKAALAQQDEDRRKRTREYEERRRRVDDCANTAPYDHVWVRDDSVSYIGGRRERCAGCDATRIVSP